MTPIRFCICDEREVGDDFPDGVAKLTPSQYQALVVFVRSRGAGSVKHMAKGAKSNYRTLTTHLEMVRRAVGAKNLTELAFIVTEEGWFDAQIRTDRSWNNFRPARRITNGCCVRPRLSKVRSK